MLRHFEAKLGLTCKPSSEVREEKDPSYFEYCTKSLGSKLSDRVIALRDPLPAGVSPELAYVAYGALVFTFNWPACKEQLLRLWKPQYLKISGTKAVKVVVEDASGIARCETVREPFNEYEPLHEIAAKTVESEVEVLENELSKSHKEISAMPDHKKTGRLELFLIELLETMLICEQIAFDERDLKRPASIAHIVKGPEVVDQPPCASMKFPYTEQLVSMSDHPQDALSSVLLYYYPHVSNKAVHLLLERTYQYYCHLQRMGNDEQQARRVVQPLVTRYTMGIIDKFTKEADPASNFTCGQQLRELFRFPIAVDLAYQRLLKEVVGRILPKRESEFHFRVTYPERRNASLIRDLLSNVYTREQLEGISKCAVQWLEKAHSDRIDWEKMDRSKAKNWHSIRGAWLLSWAQLLAGLADATLKLSKTSQAFLKRRESVLKLLRGFFEVNSIGFPPVTVLSYVAAQQSIRSIVSEAFASDREKLHESVGKFEKSLGEHGISQVDNEKMLKGAECIQSMIASIRKFESCLYTRKASSASVHKDPKTDPSSRGGKTYAQAGARGGKTYAQAASSQPHEFHRQTKYQDMERAVEEARVVLFNDNIGSWQKREMFRETIHRLDSYRRDPHLLNGSQVLRWRRELEEYLASV